MQFRWNEHTEKFALRKVRKLRKFSLFSKFSCNFFIMPETQSVEHTAIYPLTTPAHNRALRYTLGLSFGDEGFGLELIGKEGKEDSFLVEGFDGRKREFFGAFDELVSLGHMEDEFVAYEFGGGVIGIGADDVGMRFRANGQRNLSAITLSRQRTNYAESREDHRNAFDMDGHTEDDGVEIFAKHADERRIGRFEMVTETGTLVGRETELPRVRRE